MSFQGDWLFEFDTLGMCPRVEGIVPVRGFDKSKHSPEEVVAIEKAERFGAAAVFFEQDQQRHLPIPQAFIFVSDDAAPDPEFAKIHQRVWSWGGVPLIYRVCSGVVQLFRCAHKADFEKNGEIKFTPFRTLKTAGKIANDPWWNAEKIRNGAIWDDPDACRKLLSKEQASHKALINEVKALHQELDDKGILPKPLRRKLLILSLLIAYLEERQVFEDGFFESFVPGAEKFFQVLADGPALVKLLSQLEERFNGHVFVLANEDRERLLSSQQLVRFARLVEARQEESGQLTLWERYSFADLPVEVISHIYQLFVTDPTTAVYTPPFLVRLMIGEVMSWDRLDRLIENDEVILDPSCGSGVFLVEAYKRLVLHWRVRNDWKKPGRRMLRSLLKRIHGVDLEHGAVELAAFSLCLGLCDALEPAEIRSSIKLFPELQGKSIHRSCFFESLDDGVFENVKVGMVLGNPPFESKLKTDGAQRAYLRYQETEGPLPDKQLAYLFLHEAMAMLQKGGVLSLLQQYNFLYNQQSVSFRRQFIEKWDVREILDFISVRGLFKADTKVVVVVAEANEPTKDRKILHATFRRTGKAVAQQGFDIDYYDMHWISRKVATSNDAVWRSNLLGGGRVLDFVDQVKGFRTLATYASQEGWDFGEGFIEGAKGISRPADHICGKALLPSSGLTADGIDLKSITTVPNKPIHTPYSKSRYTPPMLLIKEHMDLASSFWTEHYLTYPQKIVGLCAPDKSIRKLKNLSNWIQTQKPFLRAFVAATSPFLFTQKATVLSLADIKTLPFPENESLNLSDFDKIVATDIVRYYRDLVRLGENSDALREPGKPALADFNEAFLRQINATYPDKPLKPLQPYSWPGVLCQPYVFGEGEIDWENAEELKGKLDALLKEERRAGLSVTRIAHIRDGNYFFLLKPDRLRYWLKSIALRDADELLASLWDQGF